MNPLVCVVQQVTTVAPVRKKKSDIDWDLDSSSVAASVASRTKSVKLSKAARGKRSSSKSVGRAI